MKDMIILQLGNQFFSNRLKNMIAIQANRERSTPSARHDLQRETVAARCRVERVVLSSHRYSREESDAAQPGLWPARWVACPGREGNSPFVALYLLKLDLKEALEVRLHLSGDERYELFINGERSGRGPERGDLQHWAFESYDVSLPAGEHLLVAKVWSLGEKAPHAQISLGHGFFLCPDEAEHLPLLATGVAPWKVQPVDAFAWHRPLHSAWAVGWSEEVFGERYPWGGEQGEASGVWLEPQKLAYGDSAEGVEMVCLQPWTTGHHRLIPAMLPAMLERRWERGRIRHVGPFDERPVGLEPITRTWALPQEEISWQAMIEGGADVIIPPGTRRRVVLDLEDYLCAYPEITLSGGRGAVVEIAWLEGLYESIVHPADHDGPVEALAFPKGNRDEVEGKFFICPLYHEDGGDRFHPCGGSKRTYSPLWWRSGRYVQVLVETAGEALTLEGLRFRETRYPLEMEGEFSASDPSLNALVPLMTRGLFTCAHETYMDCPFYEQLMYVGDARLEVLMTYVLTRDDRLPRKALKAFEWSHLPSGLTQSRYPARVRQVIPPFSLWWIAMCHDYALWRGDPAFVRSLLPKVRVVADYFARHLDGRGLLHLPSGWNFLDWVPQWENGVAPDGGTGFNAALNWQAVMAWKMAGDLEQWFGEPEVADLQRRRAREGATAAHACFWNEERGLYADDRGHRFWSEHAQCLALLSGGMPADAAARLTLSFTQAEGLAPATIYFSHYLFEAYRVMKRPDLLLERLETWKALLRHGLKTTIEQPEPTRSDCHAWGGHPLFHFYATLAGIRPAAPGFTEVSIEPQVDSLDLLRVTLPHPAGGEIALEVEGGELTKLSLPDGVKRV